MLLLLLVVVVVWCGGVWVSRRFCLRGRGDGGGATGEGQWLLQLMILCAKAPFMNAQLWHPQIHFPVIPLTTDQVAQKMC